MVRKGAQKISRHKKKYWRKGIDVHDVEEYLEDVRKEEQQFGGRLAEKKDVELFSLSKRPDRGLMLLKCFKSRKDQAKDVSLKRFQEPKPKQKAAVRMTTSSSSRQVAKLAPTPEEEPQPLPGYSVKFYDIWSSKDPTPADKIQDPELKEYYLRETRKKKKPLPKTVGVNESLRPNLEFPKAGISYNPSPEDHKKLLEEAAQRELEKLKRQEKLERSLFVNKDSIITPEEKLKELCEGLFPAEEEDTGANDEETNTLLTNIRPKPKTSQKRKRMIKQKQIERARREEKRKKALLNDVYRLRSIKAEIKKEQELSLKKSMLKVKKKYERLKHPHRLGRLKFEPSDEPVLLPDEVPHSLRQLRVTGDIMEERFKSWQVRNILEAQVRHKRTRKFKLIRYERKDFKEVTADYIPR
ncbi:unnamed protein product [Soboliphyme baturini]|uniref:Ribosome biogenesis protein NOP53 n=1 Tax=Soboliphyme baturini TaxID=241478 RepID=A0A183J776_9BILA|nr:unnamed protein product [Soboliphyme baturini]